MFFHSFLNAKLAERHTCTCISINIISCEINKDVISNPNNMHFWTGSKINLVLEPSRKLLGSSRTKVDWHATCNGFWEPMSPYSALTKNCNILLTIICFFILTAPFSPFFHAILCNEAIICNITCFCIICCVPRKHSLQFWWFVYIVKSQHWLPHTLKKKILAPWSWRWVIFYAWESG